MGRGAAWIPWESVTAAESRRSGGEGRWRGRRGAREGRQRRGREREGDGGEPGSRRGRRGEAVGFGVAGGLK